MKNRERGITLVALVITIIILLILAGITINSLTEGGLFEKAKLAKERHENAEKLENATLGEYKNEIEKYINNDRETTSSSTLLYPTAEDGTYANDTNATYNLNKSYENYKYLLVEVECTGSGSYSGTTTMQIPTSNITIQENYAKGVSHANWFIQGQGGIINLYFNTATSFKIGQVSSGLVITHIYGIN